MIQCSEAFHAAVAAGEKQMALFLFDGGVITNEDLDADAGVEFTDYFCTTEDIGIGEALCNTISFRLMNHGNRFANFPFGEFSAMLGARIGSGMTAAGLTLVYGGHTYSSKKTSGQRLLKDGVPTAGQPTFNAIALAAANGVVYVIGTSSRIFAVSADTGAEVTAPGNDFIRDKVSRWDGFTFSFENQFLTIKQSGGAYEQYEFVPLGVFNAEKPAVIDDAQLNLTCYDRMKKLDSDMDLPITYPITLSGLLQWVCSSEGIPTETTTFINSDVVVSAAPDEFSSCTKRDIVKWIAQAAASNAKITRWGAMKLAWLQSTGQQYAEGAYTECRPYYYTTPAVDKLCVRNTTDGGEQIIGETGSNGYLIQNNPFL